MRPGLTEVTTDSNRVQELRDVETATVKLLFPILQQKPEPRAGEGLSWHHTGDQLPGAAYRKGQQPVKVMARQ